MKKTICVITAILLMALLAACGQPAETEEPISAAEPESSGQVLGGWQIFATNAVPLPEDVQTAFDKACETITGAELIPVAYGWQQVVAGTNYMMLCRQNPSTEELVNGAGEYQMVVLYADLEGNAEFRSMTDFFIEDYTDTEGPDPASEQLAGGWAIPEDYTKVAMPEEAQTAFDKAMEGFVGNDLTPMALLGTQTVSGTNYAILCHSALVTQEPVTSLQLVTVYEDLDGNASITNICTLDPAEYNK